ncbi:hypothetical protein GCM10010435_44080 [Winogradskya consettensis]|uniref:Uncharacterized protein n=1 Tax=Winogradskya consettensis TaxID=113560 RepID=A0A919SZV9_9ACTN|nr:hypothetical protein [Actinoplanes consettensis]GIM82629.1 hypothetical protein Aco04nite_82470 [Actinoplanes consettensis]
MTATSDQALGVDEILARAERTYDYVRRASVDGFVPLTVREHFNYDIPVLVSRIQRLTSELEQERRELGRLRLQVRGGEGGNVDPDVQIVEHQGVQLRVIPMDQHDRQCDVRVASAQGTTPEVLHCHFCGFCFLQSEAVARGSDQGQGATRG